MLARQLYTRNKMEYNYSIDMVNKIIHVKVTGDIHETDAAEMGVLLRRKALDLNCKLFLDLSDAVSYILMGTAYFWVERRYDVVDERMRYISTAYLINPEQESYYNFIQTVCLNHGVKVRVFDVEDDAINWLKSV